MPLSRINSPQRATAMWCPLHRGTTDDQISDRRSVQNDFRRPADDSASL